VFSYFSSPDEKPIIKPCLDLESKFSNVEKLQENIDARGIEINAQELKQLWNIFKKLDNTRRILEERRVHIASQVKEQKLVFTLYTYIILGLFF